MGSLYDVFLCHNQADKPAVEELADRLRAAGLNPWLDKSNLRRGVQWTEEVEKCLVEESASCAVMIGPSGLGPWQKKEMDLALDRQVEAGRTNSSFPVIPVLLPGGKLETLPGFLKGHTCVSFPTVLDDNDALDELIRAIRGLPPLRTQSASSECPYRGLQYFDVAHAAYFHGREKLTARLVEKLQPNAQTKAPSRFLAIVGASGSGKSSLARAGLVAALKKGAIDGSDQWPVVICRPGSDAIANLAVELARKAGLEFDKQAVFLDRCKDRMPKDRAALHESVQLILSSSDPNGRLVILIDQFEELFTTCRDEKLRQAFVDNLVYASQVVHGQTLVLLAMRADFYGKCATYTDLANALSEHQQLIGPMTQNELWEAIEKPAQKVGCELEPGLIELLLTEVLNEPGSLPFLQFALKELWKKRTGRRLTTEAYRAIGGVTGALKRKADEVYAGLSPTQRQICRRIFLRLTQPGEGTEDTKRRVPISELRPEAGSRAEVEAVLLDLSEAETRLITGEAEDGEEFFEVAHEALIRGWPELRNWIDADRQALLTQRRLTEAANEWSKKDRETSFLYAGARLAAAREWAAAHAEEINPLESEFIKASVRHRRRKRLQVISALAAILLAVTLGWHGIRAQNIEQNNVTHAAALVRQLLAAEISQVPAIVHELDDYRHWADPLLRQQDASAAASSNQKLRLALALLQADRAKVAELRERLPLATPGEFVVVREALLPYRNSIVEPLWSVTLDAKREDQPRFQAACALAAYAPGDPRWSQNNIFVADRLVSLETSALVEWRKALRPAKTQLIKPLASIHRDTKQKEQSRTYAAETLADYAADQPAELFDLLADAEPFQFPVLFGKLAEHKDNAVVLAQKELARKPEEKASVDQKDLLAKRQANAAVALLRLGAADQVWPVLKQSPDPTVRSYIIHRFRPSGGDLQPILLRLDNEPDVTIRQALVLTLGQFLVTQLPPTQRKPLIGKLLAMYENEPSAALHGATEWVLRKWGQTQALDEAVKKLQIDDQQLRARPPNDRKEWYVSTERQTFVIVDARNTVFVMGSPRSERERLTNEFQHRRRIGRRYAIAAQEVTKSQVDRVPEGFGIVKIQADRYVRTPDSPRVGMNWYAAAAYCNWLSQQEGIAERQWCYEPNEKKQYGPGMKAKEKFWELTGYRLPTEAEWEYACRGETVTSRYFGEAETLLPRYAWYMQNGDDRTWPAGTLEPNDRGLFDMLGNVWEWCFEQYADYPDLEQEDQAVEDRPTAEAVDSGKPRMLRGGAFANFPKDLRSARRNYDRPDKISQDYGFRLAKTCP